jgi:Methylamine utilisation protein MauE
MTELVPTFVLLGQLGAAVALLVAGSAKLAEPSPIRAVIQTVIGTVPLISTQAMGWSSSVALALGIAELGTGSALILLPGKWLTAGLVIALGIVFTAAAALALGGRLQIDCACFGSTLPAPLGWRQLLLAPFWAAVALSVVVEPVALPDQRLPVAFAAVTVIGMGRLFTLLPLLAEHRTQRRIIEGSE